MNSITTPRIGCEPRKHDFVTSVFISDPDNVLTNPRESFYKFTVATLLQTTCTKCGYRTIDKAALHPPGLFPAIDEKEYATTL